MAKLYYQGHGSYRITTNDKRVIYVDPYAGNGYDLSADIILVTHEHHDHNAISLCKQNEGCVVVTNVEALEGGEHQTFSINGIDIEAVEASNLMHNPKKCVGYIISVDDIKIYASGDTSKTKQMESLSNYNIDYALFPCDGIFNMGLEESAECAKLIGAKHNIPIHMKPKALFDRKKAEKWTAPNKIIVEPDEEIEL